MPITISGTVAKAAANGTLLATPTLVGGANSTFIGNVVYQEVGISNNVPFAAAFAVVPLLVMGVYLLLARRLGAFEAL